MDVFISHSSAQSSLAGRIERALEKTGLEVWLDRSEIRIGQLLREELQSALRASRVVVLIWSKAAAKSRWVASEILTAFHLGRFIIPCAADDTKLPGFLQNSIYLDLRLLRRGWAVELQRAVSEAPAAANQIPCEIGSHTPDLDAVIRVLVERQARVMDLLASGDLTRARKAQTALNPAMKAAERRWRYESVILNLAGYHRKNAWLLKHWPAIAAGRPPRDALLAGSERKFFESLFAYPDDYSALNGLGSVLLYERELDAAEFFVRRALTLAQAAGIAYDAAEHDLRLILDLKSRRHEA